MTQEERDWRDLLDEEVDILRQTRDELRVQAHLGAAEARDAWTQLEHAWEQLQSRLQRIGDATHETAEDVEDATKLLLDELRQGYDRIKGAL